jgi:hypothetical protein
MLNELSRKILAGEVSREKGIRVDAFNGRLVFTND